MLLLGNSVLYFSLLCNSPMIPHDVSNSGYVFVMLHPVSKRRVIPAPASAESKESLKLLRPCGWDLCCNFDRWQAVKSQFLLLSKNMHLILNSHLHFSALDWPYAASDHWKQSVSVNWSRQENCRVHHIRFTNSIDATHPGTAKPVKVTSAALSQACSLILVNGVGKEFSDSLFKNPFTS